MTPLTASDLQAWVDHQRYVITHLQREYDALYEQYLTTKFLTGSDNRCIEEGLDDIARLMNGASLDLREAQRELKLARKAGA